MTANGPAGADDGSLPAESVHQDKPTPAVKPDTNRRGSTIDWYRDRLLLATVPTVLAIDQLSKYIVRNSLDLYESWPREGIFRITYGTNTGTAFGLFPNQTVFLIAASVLAIGFLFYFYRTHALPHTLLRLAIGLQLGGAFGNLTDRIWSGAVVDFIDVGRWPVFNLADSSIVVGIALLMAVVFLTNEGRPESESPG